METLWNILFLLFVSILWGVTNPLLKRASIGIENVKANNMLYQPFVEVLFLASRLNYVAPFLLNQVGGALFIYSLGVIDLSLAVPFTNSLTFLVTTMTGHFLGEEEISLPMWIGSALVCVGISMCVVDKAFD